MNNLQQGGLAIVAIAFFIIVAIVVTTPALTGTPLIQFPEQEEIIIENETAAENMTIIDGDNSTE